MKVKFVLLILGFLACAQKILPPSPDHFAPRLEEIQVINRTKITLKFDEAILSEAIKPDSFLITTTNETLLVKEISSGRKDNLITLITQKQKPVRYNLFTSVADTARNRAKIRGHFTGSTIRDSIPPKILQISPKAGLTRLKKNIRVDLRFSEEIDTVLPFTWLILPKDLTNRFKTIWQPDHKNLTFTMSDSLGPDTIIYFVFLRSVFDFEGNRLSAPGFDFFTSDSLLNTKLVTGKVTDKNEPLRDGFILFSKSADSNQAKAIIPIDTAGAFSIQIREGIYEVTALADTNFDNRIDLSGKIQGFNTAAESLLIKVYSDTLEQTLDWHLR